LCWRWLLSYERQTKRRQVKEMKILEIIIIVLAVGGLLFVVYLAYQAQISRSGTAAGLIDGKLSACPDKPNCVCSEYPEHTAHAIEPITMRDLSAAFALQKLKHIIEAQGGKIATTREDYVAATFASALFGFVDDLEIRIDAEVGVIHLRSASRVGKSDLGANRKRVEIIQKLYREKK
jgi:uncharacterized protein (DUF1499 family)